MMREDFEKKKAADEGYEYLNAEERAKKKEEERRKKEPELSEADKERIKEERIKEAMKLADENEKKHNEAMTERN